MLPFSLFCLKTITWSKTIQRRIIIIQQCRSSVTTTNKCAAEKKTSQHCQQNNRPCCCETISHHSSRYVDKTEIQYSRHALFLSECLAWIQKSDVFYSIVGICEATCERICLTSGPCTQEMEVLKVCFCASARGAGGGFQKAKGFGKSLRRSSIIWEQETGWGFALFAFMGEL